MAHFIGKRITIAPNNGNLFMVCGRYKLDSKEYKCRLSDINFIESLVQANLCRDKENRSDIRILNGESIYFDFTVDDDSKIYRTPVSSSLHHKIMDKLVVADHVFYEYSISFVLQADIELDDIDIVDKFTISTVPYDILDNNSILIDLVISCREYMKDSESLIAKMRCAVIDGIIA